MSHTRIRQMLVGLLLVTTPSSYGQTRSRQSRSKQDSNSAIRSIDFRNFTYRSTLCTQELGSEGIGKTVRVRNGQFKNAEVYYSADKAVFGDLTGDGRDEAIVVIDCNAHVANFSLSEIHIYSMKEGIVGLLASFDDHQMEHDYNSYYPDGSPRRITGVRISGGGLVVERFADGPMSCPKYIATFEYRWDGKRLRLNKRPLKRLSNLSCLNSGTNKLRQSASYYRTLADEYRELSSERSSSEGLNPECTKALRDLIRRVRQIAGARR